LSTGTQSTVPFTMMRWMSRPGNLRVLEAYTQLGGRLWIAGGGAALASLADGDQKSNNTSSNTVFAPDVDLAPTSIVVLAGHLRGRMTVTRGSVQFVRSAAARGGWSGHGVDGTLAAPDYTGLPSLLRLRDSATDPLPPTRPTSQANLFYVTSAAAEYSHGNNWSEDFGAPGSPRVEAALDTLLEVVGGTIQSPPGPAMLYYHGRENGSVLFSGLDLWSWSRSDAQALVDFVLQDVWGVTRSSRAGMRAKSPGPTAAVRMAPQRARANVTRLRTLDPPVPRP
jgi:hypothetical protein